MTESPKTIAMLPLLLSPQKAIKVPIVIAGCKRLFLGELIYRNKSQPDLIRSCTVLVNGQAIKYHKSKHNSKIYHSDFDKNGKVNLEIDSQMEIAFSLEVNCEDFDACGCMNHRFQLNLSAEYE